jgi:dipeptidyl aminopeptidase/acylaminoacyl peptidase
LIRYPKLFYWKTEDKIATMLADSGKNPAPKSWLVSGEFTPKFSKDGSKLFFGTNPKPIAKDTTLLPEEIVNLDVWNWKDKKLITQQNVTVEQDKKKSYLAVVNLKDMKLVQLNNLQLPDNQLVNEGNGDFVVATSNLKYSSQHWDWHNATDIFTVSTKTGEATKIAENIKSSNTIGASPEGKYVYWFSLPDTAWFAYSMKLAKIIRLTSDKKFADEDDDHPDFPNDYNKAGWTKNDERFLVYDRYDIWSIDPNKPTVAENLTHGREKNLTYRYVKLDSEERGIDTSKPLILRLFDNISKESGYAELIVNNKLVTEKQRGAYNFSMQIEKAKNTDDIIFTRSNFEESPNLYVSNLGFKTNITISDANPQQKNYLWGSVEIVKWKSLDGVPLEGLLYKPENFDVSKKYPMITYYYEKNADNLNQYYEPAPIRSAINIAYFVSNGYVIFVPDIVYKIGYPGASAYNCVMPGVFSLLEKGFIDKDRMGLQGHSWGGYQTAYLVTQTNLFRAAEAGAPVANMTSAYGGIRWGTGLSRQAQYESNQTRIGGTLWEKPMLYLDNSPLFQLPKVQTPLLILHNDGDDAVPWYQGIELFMGLKRLNKPTWMLTYNGEKHGVMERKNRKDFTIRMSQFFDYYLKDAPMPIWMKDGIPATEKTLNYGLGTK